MKTAFALLVLPILSEAFTTLNSNITEFLLGNIKYRVRPVTHPQEKLDIHVQSALYQVVDLDQRNNLASIAAYFDLWWHDVNLGWNPADFNQTYETYLPSSTVWIPELYLYHSVEGSTPLSLRDSAVQVDWMGKVRVFVPFTARAFCPVNVKYFPFDTQHCEFKFGSWSYKSDIVEYRVESEEVFLGDFYDNQEWLLTDSRLRQGMSEYETNQHNETYAMVILELTLARQSFYYVFNLVIPSTLVSVVSIIGLHAPGSSANPPRRESKFRLGIMTLLSMGVMLLMLVEEMPKFAMKSISGQRGSFSDVPLLGMYYITLITLVSVGTCTYTIFVLLERYGMKHRKRQDIPAFLRLFDRRNYKPCDTDCDSSDDETVFCNQNSHNSNGQGINSFDYSNREHKLSTALSQVQTRIEELNAGINAQLKWYKKKANKSHLPLHWENVISRLETISLVFYLTVIISVILLFLFPFWY